MADRDTREFTAERLRRAEWWRRIRPCEQPRCDQRPGLGGLAQPDKNFELPFFLPFNRQIQLGFGLSAGVVHEVVAAAARPDFPGLTTMCSNTVKTSA
jgi:hypothetical protein